MKLFLFTILFFLLSCQKENNASENAVMELDLQTYSLELENGGYLGSDGNGEYFSKVTASVKKKALGVKDTVLHGPFEAYIEYPCGEKQQNISALKVRGYFKDGVKHGEWKNYFYRCGSALDTSAIEVQISGTYVSGKRTGEWITARQGEALEIQHYTEGNLDSIGITQVAMQEQSSADTAEQNSAGLDLELFRGRLPEDATVKDVVKLLGTPHRIRHEEKNTTWYYNYRCHDKDEMCRKFVILFDDAKFVKVDCNDQNNY
ncbi:MAG: hypothetical protein ACLFVQ_07285 [Chitinispirillaceae bacterium]